MYRNRLSYYSLYKVTFENFYRFRKERIARTSLNGISGYRRFSSEHGVTLGQGQGYDVHQTSLTFNNGHLAMKSKSFRDILRAVIILKLCRYNAFVDNIEKVVVKRSSKLVYIYFILTQWT